MSKNGYVNTIGGWEKLLAAVRSHEGEIPGAEALRAALELRLQESVEARAGRIFTAPAANGRRGTLGSRWPPAATPPAACAVW